MTQKYAYNVNNLNSEDGTAHKVKRVNGGSVISECGFEFIPTTVGEAENPDDVVGKCKRCW